MKRISQQAGASLVMIIAVTAILLIMAAAMIALVSNAQSSRSRDRQRAQTFNAAEAALDDALRRLAANWPTTSSTSPVWGPTQEEQFKERYASDATGNGLKDQYPTLRVQEWFYDNSDENGDGVIDSNDFSYDRGGPGGVADGMMYVEVQAQDGTRSTRIRALAQRRYISSGIPRGMAWYSYDGLTTQGGSLVFGVDGGIRPAGVSIVAYVGPKTTEPNRPVGADYDSGGDADALQLVSLIVGGNYTLAPGKTPALNVTPDSFGPALADVVYQGYIAALMALAEGSGNSYTDPSEVQTQHPPGYTPPAVPSPPDTALDDLSGLVYVKTGAQDPWDMQIKGQWNSPQYPGILIVDGNLRVTGNESADYYGLIYVTGSIENLGNIKFHGIIISATGQCKLTGAQTHSYNDDVWQNLSSMSTASVRVVPNTWRELRPLPGVF